MPAALGIEVDLKDVQRAMRTAKGRAADLSPVFRREIGPDISRHLVRQFETRGRHLGTPWASLSPTTIRLRTRTVRKRGGALATTNRVGRARYGFATPLRDTGRGFLSLTRLSDPEGIREYGRHQMAWGTRVPYMAVHNRPEGFPTRIYGRGRVRHVPGRVIIPERWPADITAGWSRRLLRHLTEGI